MDAELRQLWEQRDALDALAEALRTQDGWLSYQAEALRDQLLELEGQATVRPSSIERIRAALIDRDEALQLARGDLEKVRTVATGWEAEVASVRAENREVRTWLREVQSQQSRAEERAREDEKKAKEADELKAALAAKVAALATAEEQLRQERAARQEAEGRLQQERAALANARSALERERTALERAQKSLEERDAEVSRLDGELISLSISNADPTRCASSSWSSESSRARWLVSPGRRGEAGGDVEQLVRVDRRAVPQLAHEVLARGALEEGVHDFGLRHARELRIALGEAPYEVPKRFAGLLGART
jgi:chromosome segregation ATPase